MATEDVMQRLRRMTGETDNSMYTSAQLDVFLGEVNGDLNLAASRIWGEKASHYADLVDMSEAGSSRSNSDLFAHAKEQRDYFGSLGVGDTVAPSAPSSTTRRIERV